MRKFLRITGKILFVLIFGFFTSFFIGEGIFSGEIKEYGIPIELMIVVVSFLVMLLGFIVSFKKSKLGGLIILLGGLFNAAYMIIRGGIGDLDAAGIFGLPFIVIGLIIMNTEEKNGLRF